VQRKRRAVRGETGQADIQASDDLDDEV